MDNTELHRYLAALREGNREAFAEIYNDMKTPVYTVIYRTVGSHEASEDIMQELFLRLFRSPPGGEVKNPRAYIFRAAHNLSVDYLRRNKTVALDDISESSASDTYSSDCAVDLEHALRRLSDDQRRVIALHLNAELTLRETAEILGKSVTYIHRTYSRALKTLRQLLQ